MVDVTYSLESAFVKAYSAVAAGVQGLLDAAGTLERITRPPVRHSGFDESLSVSPDGYYGYAEPDLDGAEQLAEREAEEEVWEGTPRYCGSRRPGGHGLNYRCTKWLGHDGPHGYGGVFWDADEPPPLSDTPNPTEPGLTPDELVGVRGLLQERYGEPPLSDAEASRIISDWTPEDAAALRQMRAEKRAQASLDWHGWATPAILTVLAAHFPFYDDDAGIYECVDDMGCVDASFGDTHAWREHIAPLIADRIACDPARAIAALQNFKPNLKGPQ